MALHRVLIAGIGNIFLGDDGFGVEVVRRLAGIAMPDWVRVEDFGIRGIHLAYDVYDNDYEGLILVDAAPRGGDPGTVYLIDVDLNDQSGDVACTADAHGMNPDAVCALLRSFGKCPPRVWLVGCEPAQIEEEMGLSKPVQLGVDRAVTLISSLIRDGHISREAPDAIRRPDAASSSIHE
jgi:hydrogenase maturation protease